MASKPTEKQVRARATIRLRGELYKLRDVLRNRDNAALLTERARQALVSAIAKALDELYDPLTGSQLAPKER